MLSRRAGPRRACARDKLEGDGATPAGAAAAAPGAVSAPTGCRRRCARCRVEPIAPTDGWCDDPGRNGLQPDGPAAASTPAHEELWRRDGLYDVIGVLGWNDAPVERGRGSAIFLHVARPDYAPTEGCIALALPDLLDVLRAGLSEIAVVGG